MKFTNKDLEIILEGLEALQDKIYDLQQEGRMSEDKTEEMSIKSKKAFELQNKIRESMQ